MQFFMTRAELAEVIEELRRSPGILHVHTISG
jgi:hypothetical protein